MLLSLSLLVNDVVWWWLRPRLRVALTSDQPRFDLLCLHPSPLCALVVCGDVTVAELELPQLFIGLMTSENYEAPRLPWGNRRESGADA